MSGQYQKLLEVLKRWPIDKSKGTRDYGFHLRNLAKDAFPTGAIFSGTEVENNQKFDALMRLADNKYKKKYSSSRSTGATGLTLDQLNQALTKEIVDKYMK